MKQNPLKSQQFDSLGARNMRVMKVFCPECNSKAIIRKTVRKHRHISDLYCACADVECGHTFVLNVTFTHTLSTSAKTSDKLLQTVIENLSPKQRQMAFELLKVQA